MVDDLIAKGLTLFGGPPKIGKSWLMLQLGIAVSAGTPFLDHETSKSGVLYLALEDSESRIRHRARLVADEVGEGMYIATCAERVASGLIEQIDSFVAGHPDTRLAIIDTLEIVRSCDDAPNAYAGYYKDLTPLKQLAGQLGIAIVTVHHTRKKGDSDVFATISGTNGMAGCADSAMVLTSSNRAAGTAVLSLTGRDVDHAELAMRLRDCRWELTEWRSRDEIARSFVPEEVLSVADFVIGAGDWQGTTTRLAEAIGLQAAAAAKLGRQLAQHADYLADCGVEYSRRRTSTGAVVTLSCIKDPERTS